MRGIWTRRGQGRHERAEDAWRGKSKREGGKWKRERGGEKGGGGVEGWKADTKYRPAIQNLGGKGNEGGWEG